MNARTFLGGIGLVAALALTACGGGGETAATDTAGEGAAGGATTLQVGADPSGTLAFQPTTMSAPANQPLTVNFENPAPVPHNWVLVEPGQEQAVADAGQANGGAVPDGTPGVIAKTGVQNQNGSETVTVPAQPAGTYPYICTVPGHYPAGMKGTMTVQ